MHPSTITTIPEALVDRITPVDTEDVAARDAVERVLAENVVLDRPSPACDVSAMDGYALRLPLPPQPTLRVLGEALPGRPAPALPEVPGAAVRIFTGAPVPRGATLVIQREWFDERGNSVTLRGERDLKDGLNIRRKGENGEAGEIIRGPGALIDPALRGGIASCGMTTVTVYRPLRVAVLVTGDEVLTESAAPDAWSLRDGNGPTLRAMLDRRPWIAHVEHRRAGDTLKATTDAARQLLESHDALIMTGGVSAGDHDYVPRAVHDLELETLFHGLAIRPGKPVLGAVDRSGRPVLGLPGNPVSALVTGTLLALPALRARAGMTASTNTTLVMVDDDAAAPPALTWFPLVRLEPGGRAVLLKGRGSGDWIAAARSDGFIEVPPGERARGMRSFRPWSF